MLQVTVLNYKIYNPRDDIKNPSWFRMERNWWVDTFRWSNETKLVWFMLLGMMKPCGTRHDVDPGFMAINLGLDEKVIRESMTYLVDKKRIYVDPPLDKVSVQKKRSVITDDSVDALRARNADVTHTIATGHNVTGHNGTRHNRTRPAKLPTPPSASDLAVGTAWLELALAEMPWRSGAPAFAPDRFAEGVAKLRKATGLNEDGTREVLEFITRDEFWKRNALSPSALLKKSERNGHRKIDNILLQMKAQPKYKAQQTADAIMRWAEE